TTVTLAPTDAPTSTVTPPPTDAPTTTVTPAPTDAPTTTVTLAPTDAPTTTITPAPTDAPTTTVTPAPTDAPTTTVTSPPTDAPTTTVTPPPTDAPKTTVTPLPTGAPTTTVSPAPSNAPTRTVTPAPTDAPMTTVSPTTVTPVLQRLTTVTPRPTSANTATVAPSTTMSDLTLSSTRMPVKPLPRSTVPPTTTATMTTTRVPTTTVVRTTVVPTSTLRPTTTVISRVANATSSPLEIATSGTTWSAIASGVDYPGNDLASTDQDSAEDCMVDCDATVGCVAFVWTAPGTCWLKKAKGSPTKAHHKVLSAFKAQPTKAAQCGKLGARVFSFDNTLKITRRSTPTACCDDCRAVTGCTLFIWIPFDSGTCYLKSALGRTIPRADAYVMTLEQA
ncbi:hypothetical protein As57867_020880, partial [Aphanomyces stellatus]